MKTLEFIYQDTQIHFALQNEGNVMVNATEMAKAFNKRIDVFLKADHTKKFIEYLKSREDLFPPYGGNKIIETNNKAGTYMCDILALKFAAWLDVEFEFWVYHTINEVLFGNYKKHWDAHITQTKAEQLMEDLKPKLLVSPTPEMMLEYFEAERTVKTAKSTKRKAIANQYKMEL